MENKLRQKHIQSILRGSPPGRVVWIGKEKKLQCKVSKANNRMPGKFERFGWWKKQTTDKICKISITCAIIFNNQF